MESKISVFAAAGVTALTRMPRVATLSQIVSYTDEHLRIREIDDWANALNGLQVENSGTVTKIEVAVMPTAYRFKKGNRIQVRPGARSWMAVAMVLIEPRSDPVMLKTMPSSQMV